MSAVAAQAPPKQRRPRMLFRVPDVRLSAAWRLWQRNATIYRHTYKFNILPNFFEPFFYLLAMGLGLSAYLSHIGGFSYIDFIAPGLVTMAAMYGSSFEVTFNCFVKMQFGKVYDAAMATPLSIEDVALGELLWGTSRSALYGVLFMAVASLFGVMHSWLALFGPLALVLIGMMFSVIGFSFTAVVPIIDYFSYYFTLFLTPMFLFSGVFFPLDRLPGWVHVLAWFMPLTHAVDLLRALTLTGDPGSAAAAALWMLVLTAALFVLPLNLIHRRLVR